MYKMKCHVCAKAMFLILVFLTIKISPCVGGVTKCAVAASPVEEGRPTSITCHFDENLRDTRAAVNLHKITSEKQQVLLASYVWQRNSTEPTITQYLKGYRVKQLDGTRLIIIIDSASPDQTGGYQCQRVHDYGKRHSTCYVEVKEKPPKTSCSVDSVPEGENTALTCLFNKNILRGYKIYVLQKRSEMLEEFETVIDCAQDENLGEFPVCKSTVEGFHVNPKQTTARSFLVHMVNVSKTSEGTYICRIVSSANPEKEETCDFELSEPMAADDSKGLIIGICVAFAVIASAVTGFVCYIRRRRRWKSKNSHIAKPETASKDVSAKMVKQPPFFTRMTKKTHHLLNSHNLSTLKDKS